MKARSVAISLCILISNAYAGDWGSVETLRSSHPEFFMPGRVSIATNEGSVYYVYNGMSTRRFHREPYSRLRSVAKMRAEGSLAKFVCGNQVTYDVTIEGGLQIARYEDGDRVMYLFAAPTANVFRVEWRVGDAASHHSLSNNTEVIQAANERKVSQDNGSVMLKLCDAVDAHPEDGVLRWRLAKVYFDAHLYDEAETEVRHSVSLLLKKTSRQWTGVQMESLLECAEILMQVGDCRLAKEIYQKVKVLGKTKFTSMAMQGLSAANLKLGL